MRRRVGRPRERLSRVYLDDYPVTLMGDEAQPPLSRIVRAGGKNPERVDVLYLTSPGDGTGRRVDPEEIIDRTAEPTRPIYLRSVARAEGPPAGIPDQVSPEAVRRLGESMPNVDRVVSQLGKDAVWPRRHHEPWVFRSPTSSGGPSKDTAQVGPFQPGAVDPQRDAAVPAPATPARPSVPTAPGASTKPAEPTTSAAPSTPPAPATPATSATPAASTAPAAPAAPAASAAPAQAGKGDAQDAGTDDDDEERRDRPRDGARSS